MEFPEENGELVYRSFRSNWLFFDIRENTNAYDKKFAYNISLNLLDKMHDSTNILVKTWKSF